MSERSIMRSDAPGSRLTTASPVLYETERMGQISAWRHLFSRAGYRFVTVDSNGINAFFIDPAAFPTAFVEDLRGAAYRPNTSHTREYGLDWRRQLERLEARELVEVK
jgi:hypothetical protein